ncbi:hypothetical protein Tco_0222662 [Tanacetum coccineum]
MVGGGEVGRGGVGRGERWGWLAMVRWRGDGVGDVGMMAVGRCGDGGRGCVGGDDGGCGGGVMMVLVTWGWWRLGDGGGGWRDEDGWGDDGWGVVAVEMVTRWWRR